MKPGAAIDLNELLKSVDKTLLKEQIYIRWQLISDMVGWLYPSVLRGEIDKLQQRIDELER